MALSWMKKMKEHRFFILKHLKPKVEEVRFIPLKYRPSAELPDKEYPLILTTGRSLYHYQTSTMTGAVEGLKKLYGEDYIDMCQEDALKLGVEDA